MPKLLATKMRDLLAPEINRYRITIAPHVLAVMVKGEGALDPRYNGMFLIPPLKVMASAGGGWDHVSVSTDTRCPTWTEMSYVHRRFFNPHEVAMQLHLPENDHINNHPFTLHLWRPWSKLRRIPLPPKSMV
jgi:hypothetical protein